MKAFYKQTKTGTPRKGTPRKGTPRKGTPKRIIQQKSVLPKEQMKDQRRITDLFARRLGKRKLEKPAPELSPKRTCISPPLEENTVMGHTPQKFKPSLRCLLEQKTKIEVLSPDVKDNASSSLNNTQVSDNKQCAVINLLSDDEDSTGKPVPPKSKSKNLFDDKIDSIISCITKEEIEEDAVVGTIVSSSMIKEEGFHCLHFSFCYLFEVRYCFCFFVK